MWPHSSKLNFRIVFALSFLISCDQEERVIHSPVVTTAEVTAITDRNALTGGDVIGSDVPVAERGVVIGFSSGITKENATVIQADTHSLGQFSVEVNDLVAGTRYYVRAYAVNRAGVGYGEELIFETLFNSPVLTTLAASDVATTSAILHGHVVSEGSLPLEAFGFCWSTTHEQPDIESDQKIELQHSPDFQTTLTALSPNTTYYVRAFGVNEKGIFYGEAISFTTEKTFDQKLNGTWKLATIDGFIDQGPFNGPGGPGITYEEYILLQNDTLKYSKENYLWENDSTWSISYHELLTISLMINNASISVSAQKENLQTGQITKNTCSGVINKGTFVEFGFPANEYNYQITFDPNNFFLLTYVNFNEQSAEDSLSLLKYSYDAAGNTRIEYEYTLKRIF